MITLTSAARDYLTSTIHKAGESVDETAVRFGIKGGGCSGFSYVINFCRRNHYREGFDHLFEFQGLAVYVDKKSLKLVNETEIHWEVKDMTRRFVFRNPNAKASCGCGTSVLL